MADSLESDGQCVASSQADSDPVIDNPKSKAKQPKVTYPADLCDLLFPPVGKGGKHLCQLCGEPLAPKKDKAHDVRPKLSPSQIARHVFHRHRYLLEEPTKAKVILQYIYLVILMSAAS